MSWQAEEENEGNRHREETISSSVFVRTERQGGGSSSYLAFCWGPSWPYQSSEETLTAFLLPSLCSSNENGFPWLIFGAVMASNKNILCYLTSVQEFVEAPPDSLKKHVAETQKWYLWCATLIWRSSDWFSQISAFPEIYLLKNPIKSYWDLTPTLGGVWLFLYHISPSHVSPSRLLEEKAHFTLK